MNLERDLRKDEGRGKAIRNDALPLQLCINCKRRKEQSGMTASKIKRWPSNSLIINAGWLK